MGIYPETNRVRGWYAGSVSLVRIIRWSIVCEETSKNSRGVLGTSGRHVSVMG